MLATPLLLLQVAASAPAPTPTPAVGRVAATESRPADISSYAGKVKIDRGKANTLFQQDAALPATPASAASAPPAGGDARALAASTREESRWRSLATSRQRALEAARADLAAAQTRYPMAAYGVLASAQRNAMLAPYQDRVARAQAAVDALPDECRRSPGCQPGWVR